VNGTESRLSRLEQIIENLCEQEAGGKTADVCRKYEISNATFYKWKAKYGGLDVSDAKLLKALDETRTASLTTRCSRRWPQMMTPVVRRDAVAQVRVAV
jgi:putative transposase